MAGYFGPSGDDEDGHGGTTVNHQTGCAREHDTSTGCSTSAIPFGDHGSAWFDLDPAGPVLVSDIPPGAAVDLDAATEYVKGLTALQSAVAPVPSPRRGRAAGAAGAVLAAAAVLAVHAPALAQPFI